MTEAQATLIRDIAGRILSVNIEALPMTGKIAGTRIKFNPQTNAKASQAEANDILARMDAFSVGTASACIDSLKIAARRAGLR